MGVFFSGRGGYRSCRCIADLGFRSLTYVRLSVASIGWCVVVRLPPQDAIRKRAGAKIEGGKIIKIEAHPIPENYRPRRVVGRMALVGDAAGYVTKCSGEGIYFAAKSGRMAAEAVVECIKQTGKLPTEKQLKQTYLKDYDKLYKPTYLVLDILQKVILCDFLFNLTRFRGGRTLKKRRFRIIDETQPPWTSCTLAFRVS